MIEDEDEIQQTNLDDVVTDSDMSDSEKEDPNQMVEINVRKKVKP
jgi:hypothetical protein